MEYYIAKTLKNTSLVDVENTVREKLADHGFGIITEIDVTQTFKKKLDVDFKPYKILGACNPGYAHKALSKADKIGVMLPCNVCIQQKGDNDVEVFTINPLVAMQPMDLPEMKEFADEVYQHLNEVIEEL